MGKTVREAGYASVHEKHPHVCGEDCRASSFSGVGSETPPRVWGRLSASKAASISCGNTPTCVGKTVLGEDPEAACLKHPHVCGEDGLLSIFVGALWETPPRVWGRLFFPRSSQHRGRNTPTCVGKTKGVSVGREHEEKHPHVCGEDNAQSANVAALAETPPRVWGRPFTASIFQPSSRNTPTCVGKTTSQRVDQATYKKHPHVCGEDKAAVPPRNKNSETPPRVWGRLRRIRQNIITYGNTPTCVGKTPDVVHSVSGDRKHPHVCGEDGRWWRLSPRGAETPPRVWGRPVRSAWR